MRKLEFVIQVLLATGIIFGLLGLGGLIATTAKADTNLGNLDPAVVTPPTRDDSQDPKPKKTAPQIENHGANIPDNAIPNVLDT